MGSPFFMSLFRRFRICSKPVQQPGPSEVNRFYALGGSTLVPRVPGRGALAVA